MKASQPTRQSTVRMQLCNGCGESRGFMDKNKSGMSLYAFIASTTFAIAISVAGIVTMMLWSWWGLALVGVGVGILTIVYNKV